MKLMTEQIESHESCECVIVHPTGQIQVIRDCWCKVYHSFGQQFQIEHIDESHVVEDIHCYFIKDGHKNNLPPNMYLERKLGRKVFGAGIFFRKGGDITGQKAKDILTK